MVDHFAPTASSTDLIWPLFHSQEGMGADAFVASSAISISDIVDNDADTKEMVVELEPSGKLKIKVCWSVASFMATVSHCRFFFRVCPILGDTSHSFRSCVVATSELRSWCESCTVLNFRDAFSCPRCFLMPFGVYCSINPGAIQG